MKQYKIIILAFITLILLNYTLYLKGHLSKLPIDDAQQMVIANFGNCLDDGCQNMNITVTKKDGKNLVIADFIWLKDDSIHSIREQFFVIKDEDKWKLWEKLTPQFICQKDRGQQQFSETFCK